MESDESSSFQQEHVSAQCPSISSHSHPVWLCVECASVQRFMSSDNDETHSQCLVLKHYFVYICVKSGQYIQYPAMKIHLV